MSETAEPAVLEERLGGVALLTLNVPDKRNALIPAVRDGLLAALLRLDGDNDCRAIVLTGAGGAFCAGGDISDPGPFTSAQVRNLMKRPHALVRAISNHSKPIIAAVDGPAFGAGFALACACDFVAAGDNASFCAAYGRVGVMPDVGLLWSLPLRVSMNVVRRIVMFSDVIKPEEAKSLNIVDWYEVGRTGQEIAVERATVLAEKATASIAATKAVLARAPLDMETVFAAEIEGQAWLSSTEDAQEGVRAFREKRRPSFKGY